MKWIVALACLLLLGPSWAAPHHTKRASKALTIAERQEISREMLAAEDRASMETEKRIPLEEPERNLSDGERKERLSASDKLEKELEAKYDAVIEHHWHITDNQASLIMMEGAQKGWK